MKTDEARLEASFRDATLWREEADALRAILRRCGLQETWKWGKPCYTFEGGNICIIQRMKDFLALMFFKGALLKDPDGVLEVQGPNSRAGYRMRFTSVRDVKKLAKSVRHCVSEAIEVEKAGLEVAPAPDREQPEELQLRFTEDAAFKAAFERLTPGRQRGYLLHFSDARHSQTRSARIERHRTRILAGKGLNDR